MNNRRRVLCGGKEDDPYKGFLFGYYTLNGNDLASDRGCVVSPYIEVTAHNYKILINGQLHRLKSDYTRVSGKDIHGTVYNQQSNVISIYNIKYFRFYTTIATLDDSYILDTTTGEYIFKGKNVS